MMNHTPPLAIIRQRFVSTPEYEKLAEAELSQTNCNDCQSASEADVSATVAALFAQRQAAQQAAFSSPPRPGLVVRISPDDQTATPGASTEPLAVLLDAEIAVGKWRGWLVGRDPGYACEWDMILGPEDEPRDPLCQVVQVWNPVSLTVAPTDCVLAALSADRLAAARALAKDFTQLKVPNPIDDNRMGVILARELTDGTGVVTGASVKSQTDPRHEYQQLYREAALQVSQRHTVAQIVL